MVFDDAAEIAHRGGLASKTSIGTLQNVACFLPAD